MNDALLYIVHACVDLGFFFLALDLSVSFPFFDAEAKSHFRCRSVYFAVGVLSWQVSILVDNQVKHCTCSRRNERSWRKR